MEGGGWGGGNPSTQISIQPSKLLERKLPLECSRKNGSQVPTSGFREGKKNYFFPLRNKNTPTKTLSSRFISVTNTTVTPLLNNPAAVCELWHH